ncbi:MULTISPECIES: hypothetical protein [unclassified Mesorhizobium]|uniref:hypothetical protein n=1 Tax=unclassified Mesorhizobium TaxID=325217 RepID=UPI000FE2E9E8|nr:MULTISPECIES: hypothetical protein [unclassified Mesorhizobium]MDG4887924.1 hypothetical protein [Mesorhizobium sp. WSM4887]RWK27772.1 MAG: hypothetical protein EOR40_29260 [Mesorhizobium sp.]TIQ07606.1 MAG: hypothetical protein E5X50_14610 [Mesorhizobium sp.]TJW06482.1 MAG: hypothetical protein E5X42_29325 [Mesorhizobium sp.]
MRNLPVLLVALGGLTAFVIPAAAESDHHGSCAAASAAASATIDLEAIPITSATDPKAVKSVGDDECDGSKFGSHANAGQQDEAFGDSDDD